MNALSLEVISNPILRATIRDIMERVYGITPTPGQMELTNTFPGSTPNCEQTTQRFEDAAIPATGAGYISEEAA
jgi:hypothetical protein